MKNYKGVSEVIIHLEPSSQPKDKSSDVDEND